MGRVTRAVAMSEAELQENVRRLCAHLSLFHYHPYSSVRSERGWPDSVIIGRGGLIYRELKSEGGRPTPEQVKVGYLLKAVGASWAIWRPSDWYSGKIEQELTILAAIQGELFPEYSQRGAA